MHPLVIILDALFAALGGSWSEDRRPVGVLARFKIGSLRIARANFAKLSLKPNTGNKDREKCNDAGERGKVLADKYHR